MRKDLGDRAKEIGSDSVKSVNFEFLIEEKSIHIFK